MFKLLNNYNYSLPNKDVFIKTLRILWKHTYFITVFTAMTSLPTFKKVWVVSSI